MKSILIVSHAMELGGAENALLGLLENLDPNEYHVDLFLLRHTGELLRQLPEYVNLLPENPRYSCMAIPMGQVIRRKQFGVALARLIGKLCAKRKIKQLGFQDSDIELEYSHKYTVHAMPMISDKEYDLAISFLTPHYYVIEKVKAKRKAAWIHTDYSKVRVDRASQLQMWDRYDTIVSISDRVTDSFLSVFPELKEKVTVIGNMLPAAYIGRVADAMNAKPEMPEDGAVRLLSIGRFCVAKNFDSIPEICRNIIEAGISVKWYIIGFGGDEALIRQQIQRHGMEEHVIILGKKDNPYPYIKACDIYVQPSRYEGKCVSVIEAQALHKPVVITNYATSSSQLKNGVDGVIVPQDHHGCAEALAKIINDRELQEKLIANTYKTDYSNSHEVIKISKIIQG